VTLAPHRADLHSAIGSSREQKRTVTAAACSLDEITRATKEVAAANFAREEAHAKVASAEAQVLCACRSWAKVGSAGALLHVWHSLVMH
jgi:hypothetical protein